MLVLRGKPNENYSELTPACHLEWLKLKDWSYQMFAGGVAGTHRHHHPVVAGGDVKCITKVVHRATIIHSFHSREIKPYIHTQIYT